MVKDFFIYTCLCVVLCLYSCKQKGVDNVERVSIPLQVISEDMMTSMPGTLLVHEKEVIWIDAISDNSIHIVDKRSGEEIKTLYVKGDGPNEIITPDICRAPNRCISVFDSNGAKEITIFLDSLNVGHSYKKEIRNFDKQMFGLRIIPITHNQKVFVTPDSATPFLLLSHSKIAPFGTYPLKEVKEISNKFDVFQGTAIYNPYSGILLHSIGQLSYVALYTWNGTQFILDEERNLSEVDYSLRNGNLIINRTPQHAPTAVAMTKDYIVSIERDKQSSPMGIKEKRINNDRPFSKAPHTVFVYDHDFNLIKIVDVNMPIIRIAANGDSNEVYLVGVNPEFCIAKLDLP